MPRAQPSQPRGGRRGRGTASRTNASEVKEASRSEPPEPPPPRNRRSSPPCLEPHSASASPRSANARRCRSRDGASSGGAAGRPARGASRSSRGENETRAGGSDSARGDAPVPQGLRDRAPGGSFPVSLVPETVAEISGDVCGCCLDAMVETEPVSEGDACEPPSDGRAEAAKQCRGTKDEALEAQSDAAASLGEGEENRLAGVRGVPVPASTQLKELWPPSQRRGREDEGDACECGAARANKRKRRDDDDEACRQRTKGASSGEDADDCAGGVGVGADDAVPGEERPSPGVLLGRVDCCLHSFHLHCIEGWSRRETTCPLCKAVFTAIAAYDLRTGRLLAQHACDVVFQADASTSEEDDEEEEEEEAPRGAPRRSRRMSSRTAECLRRSLREHHRTHISLTQQRRRAQASPAWMRATSVPPTPASATLSTRRGGGRGMSTDRRPQSEVLRRVTLGNAPQGCSVLWTSGSSSSSSAAPRGDSSEAGRASAQAEPARRRSRCYSSAGSDASDEETSARAGRRGRREKTRDALEAIRRTERHLARLKFFNFTTTLQQQPEAACNFRGAVWTPAADTTSGSAAAGKTSPQSQAETPACLAQTAAGPPLPSFTIRLRRPTTETGDTPRETGSVCSHNFPSETGRRNAKPKRGTQVDSGEAKPQRATEPKDAGASCVAVVVPWKTHFVPATCSSGRNGVGDEDAAVTRSSCGNAAKTTNNEVRSQRGASFGNFVLNPRYEEDFLIQRKD